MQTELNYYGGIECNSFDIKHLMKMQISWSVLLHSFCEEIEVETDVDWNEIESTWFEIMCFEDVDA